MNGNGNTFATNFRKIGFARNFPFANQLILRCEFVDLQLLVRLNFMNGMEMMGKK